MKTSISQPDWQFLYALPNLCLRDPIETEHIAVVPFDEDRLTSIRNNSAEVDKLLSSFTDQFQKKIMPSALIINTNSARLRDKEGFYRFEAIIDFRNLVALCCIVKGWALAIESEQFLRIPPYSDYFEFHPVTVGRQKGYLYIDTPMSRGIHIPKEFAGQCSMQVVHRATVPPYFDNDLYKERVPFWKRLHIQRRGSRRLRALFRSIQVAYQASYSPFESNSYIYNIGTRIVLWVSAFEVLTHPGPSGQASVRSVRDWGDEFVPQAERSIDPIFVPPFSMVNLL